MTESVLNPSPVPIRLSTAAMGAYVKLTRTLHAAADQAAAAGSALTATDTERAEWYAVRDALRTAAGEAMVPRGGTGAPRCRRCGIDCAECAPPVGAAAAESTPPGIVVALTLDGYGHTRHLLPQPGVQYRVGMRAEDTPAAILAGRPTEITGTIAAQVHP